MLITSTDVKNNFGKYVRLAAKEDVIITKNGKKVAKLVAYNKCNESDDDNYGDDGSSGSCMVKENASAYNFDRQKVTYEEFLEITANSDERYEYIDGEIYLLASPKTTHQRILFEMSVIFYNWFKGKKCTPMFAPYDIKLKRNEKNKNVVQPDLMVICDLEENLSEDDYYTGVPVLVAEIISDSTKSKDYIKKLDLYMSCGVGEYWIIDPEAKETHVFCFKDKNIYLNKTYAFNDEIKSFYFEGLTASLKEFS